MIEIVWQYDPLMREQDPAPATAIEARQALTSANQVFAETLWRAEEGTVDVRKVVRLSAKNLGLATAANPFPDQEPFAVVLGCADARVPPEMIWWQEANDLFVVRVAGNTPGSHSLGSLGYALNHLSSVRLLVVLGHTGCGAVTAAVDAFLTPASYIAIAANMPLRTIVDSIMTAVCGAADTLGQVYGASARTKPGFRDALIELSVILNAALTAAAVRQIFQEKLGPNLAVVYGVYHLGHHLVGLPDDTVVNRGWQAALREPPLISNELIELAQQMAQSRFIAQLMHVSGSE